MGESQRPSTYPVSYDVNSCCVGALGVRSPLLDGQGCGEVAVTEQRGAVLDSCWYLARLDSSSREIRSLTV